MWWGSAGLSLLSLLPLVRVRPAVERERNERAAAAGRASLDRGDDERWEERVNHSAGLLPDDVIGVVRQDHSS